LKSISYLNFLLIPILAGTITLFYLRKSNFIEGLIFATHVFTLQNFLLILCIGLFFLSSIIPAALKSILLILLAFVLIYFLIYIFLALHQFKKQSYIIGSLKFIGINLIFPLIYLIALVVSIFMSVTIF